MSGNALIYTTGKSSDTVTEGLWPFTISGYTLSSVSRDTSNYWEELSTVEDGTTITVSYRQNLSATEWDTSTESIKVRGAEGASGNGLTISSKHEAKTGTLTLDLSATTTTTAPTTPPPTTPPPTTPSPTTPPPTTPYPSPSPTPAPSHSPTVTGATPDLSFIPTNSPSPDPTLIPTSVPTSPPQLTPAPTTPMPTTSVLPTLAPSTTTTETSDGYELCVVEDGTGSTELKILRNSDTEMIRIKISGKYTFIYVG